MPKPASNGCHGMQRPGITAFPAVCRAFCMAPVRRQVMATRVISGCPYYLVRLIAGIWPLHIAVECDIQSGQ
jgi:hypothetical protein